MLELPPLRPSIVAFVVLGTLFACEPSGPIGAFFSRDAGDDPAASPCGFIESGWTCEAEQLCDGACDCGCGVPDPECASASVMACDFDNCPEGAQPVAADPARCTNDPCAEATNTGFCTTDNGQALYLFCSQPTGNGTPELYTYYCETWERCEAPGGKPRCVAMATLACRPGEVRCADAGDVALTCTPDGQWSQAPCDGCRLSQAGAVCELGETTAVEGQLVYTFRTPLADLSDWGSEAQGNATDLLVLSLRGDDC